MLFLWPVAFLIEIAGTAAVPYAVAACPYGVAFPAPFTERREGGVAEAELLDQGLRLSVLCFAAAVPAPSSGEAQSRLEALAGEIGLANAAVQPLPAADCAEARGDLTSGQPYKLIARLCVAASSVFLVEAVYLGDGRYDAARRFIDGVTVNAGPKN